MSDLGGFASGKDTILHMNKAELRRVYLNQLKSLTPTEAETLSQQIADRLFASFDFSRFSTVHVFLPIRKNNEIDTWLIVKRIWADFSNIKVVVPRTNPVTFAMTSHLLTATTPLTETRWGVPEPEAANAIDPDQVDCVLLPLLAYDHTGYRVGYGKGFYDRFLAQCRADVLKIGLSYFGPVTKIEDTDAYDIPLHYCVTPEKVWAFQTLQGF